MVRQEQHLGSRRQIAQRVEPGLRARVVEVDEQVVGDERQRSPAAELQLQRRDSQREEQLVTRSFAQPRDLDRCALRPSCIQCGRRPFGIDGQPREFAQREPRENFARAPEHRPLLLVAIAIRRPLQQPARGGRLQILLGCIAHRRQRFLPFRLGNGGIRLPIDRTERLIGHDLLL